MPKSKSVKKPAGLTSVEKKTLGKILGKARAFRRYYAENPLPVKGTRGGTKRS